MFKNKNKNPRSSQIINHQIQLNELVSYEEQTPESVTA